METEELEPSAGDAADDVAAEDTRIESTSEVIEETVITGGSLENITAQSADEGVLDKSHESAAELSPAKSTAKPVEKVEEPVPEVVQQSELRAPAKSRQSCKTRLSETSIQEDVSVDDVMPRPAKVSFLVSWQQQRLVTFFGAHGEPDRPVAVLSLTICCWWLRTY